MRTKTSVWLLASLMVYGCGSDGKSDEKDDAAQQQADSYSKTDCTDPAQNPYAGTCVETFWAGGCFMPTGACTGVVNVELTGTSNTELSWANGHKVTAISTLDLSGIDLTMYDPNNPPSADDIVTSTNISILGAGGTTCATGVSKTNDAGCFQRTVYTRADGQAITFCTSEDGKTTLTCNDGTMVDVSGGKGAEACQTGEGSGEQCDVTVNQPEGGATGYTLPGS